MAPPGGGNALKPGRLKVRRRCVHLLERVVEEFLPSVCRYLQERFSQLQEEVNLLKSNIMKYKVLTHTHTHNTSSIASRHICSDFLFSFFWSVLSFVLKLLPSPCRRRWRGGRTRTANHPAAARSLESSPPNKVNDTICSPLILTIVFKTYVIHF